MKNKNYEPRYIKNSINNIEFSIFDDETKKTLSDLLFENDKIVLLGNPGIGKTTELDLLYEKLGENTYLEHFKNKDVFGNQTAKFISEIENLKTQLQKKVGIVTITIGINYGNRLQNYALQEVIKNLTTIVVTL